jgi:RNA polymerase sigma factor (sigma-70 family)
MTPRSSDAQLIEDLRAGRSDAFERLYADYHAPIYNLCARLVGDREEAKDLTQDAFIAAFSSPPPADARLKLRPWLYRVATNACLNHLRSRKGLGGGDPALIDELPSQVDGFAQAETVALVEATLGHLNDRYRTALVLKDLQGLPPAEIAAVMEVSRPAADVLVHRARGAFKVAFAKLAGGAPAPASLALVLVPLSVPAALRMMPPVPHAVPAAHAPVTPGPAHPGLHLPHISSAAGPGGAGLLTKIGAALTTKVGITAAVAVLAVGGAAAVRDVEHSHAARHHPAAASRAWQPTLANWSKQSARWSLYSFWIRYGWPMDWNAGRWAWNSGSCSWTWEMSGGSKWSSGSSQMTSSGSWSGGSWTMSMSRTDSSGWSSGSQGGSGASSKWSGSVSGSKSGGSWSGSGSKSGSGWSSGGSSDSGSSWSGGSGGGSGGGSSAGSGESGW